MGPTVKGYSNNCCSCRVHRVLCSALLGIVRAVERNKATNFVNHKQLIIKITPSLDCDWFKNPIFHSFTCQVVIGHLLTVIGQFVIEYFVIGQFNKPITFKVAF